MAPHAAAVGTLEFDHYRPKYCLHSLLWKPELLSAFRKWVSKAACRPKRNNPLCKHGPCNACMRLLERSVLCPKIHTNTRQLAEYLLFP
jgi:hypothetical protein